jgi:hypothetical protein
MAVPFKRRVDATLGTERTSTTRLRDLVIRTTDAPSSRDCAKAVEWGLMVEFETALAKSRMRMRFFGLANVALKGCCTSDRRMDLVNRQRLLLMKYLLLFAVIQTHGKRLGLCRNW